MENEVFVIRSQETDQSTFMPIIDNAKGTALLLFMTSFGGPSTVVSNLKFYKKKGNVINTRHPAKLCMNTY